MRKKILQIICPLLCGSLLLPAIAWSVPRVVVSIKPIHALVAGVMQGVAEPQLLVKGGASPHGYVLRPSDARALSRADLIVWVGPQLESFLKKPLATLGKRARQLQLTEALADQLLPLRKSGSWEGQQHGKTQLAERLLVAVRAEQRLPVAPDLVDHAGEGLVDLGLGAVVLGAEQPLADDLGEVALLEVDDGEAALVV